jgi:protein TonB
MTVFRRQKVTDELYRVIPRYFSDEALASMAAPIPAPVERPEHLETPSAQRRSTSALVYLLPVVVALVAWGGWVLRGSWTAKTQDRTSEESPQPALSPMTFQTERPSEPSVVRQLQSEVASLKAQLGALRSEQQAPSTPLAERSPSRRGTGRPDTAPTPAHDRRLDSLTHQIAYLEEMIHRQSQPTEPSPDVANRAGKSPGTRSEIAPVEAVHSDAPSQAPGQPATPSPLPPATEHPSSQQSAVQDTRQSEPTPASPLQARAYAEALVDTPPVLVSSPAPEYPTRLRRLRIEGDVLVSLLVSADGQVAQVVPLRGRTELRQAAAEGIRRWRYEPARLNGAAVPCWTTASIAFRVP